MKKKQVSQEDLLFAARGKFPTLPYYDLTMVISLILF